VASVGSGRIIPRRFGYLSAKEAVGGVLVHTNHQGKIA